MSLTKQESMDMYNQQMDTYRSVTERQKTMKQLQNLLDPNSGFAGQLLGGPLGGSSPWSFGAQTLVKTPRTVADMKKQLLERRKRIEAELKTVLDAESALETNDLSSAIEALSQAGLI